MTDEGFGLREQKRRATRRALQIALLEGALERGLDNVTVEDACRAAQVSPRTFFNYFASKEEAIAGSGAPLEVTEAQLGRFVAGESDVLTDLVHLIADTTDDTDDVEVHRLRKQLLEREPQLLATRMAETQRFHRVAVQATTERLRAESDGREGGSDEVELGQRAGLVVLTAAAIARNGWSRWVGSGGGEALEECVDAAYGDFREIAAAAVASAKAPVRS